MFNIILLEGMRKLTCLDSLLEATAVYKEQRVTFIECMNGLAQPLEV